jgi:hypothetical protein
MHVQNVDATVAVPFVQSSGWCWPDPRDLEVERQRKNIDQSLGCLLLYPEVSFPQIVLLSTLMEGWRAVAMERSTWSHHEVLK